MAQAPKKVVNPQQAERMRRDREKTDGGKRQLAGTTSHMTDETGNPTSTLFTPGEVAQPDVMDVAAALGTPSAKFEAGRKAAARANAASDLAHFLFGGPPK